VLCLILKQSIAALQARAMLHLDSCLPSKNSLF
jgi:hypothetical protein